MRIIDGSHKKRQIILPSKIDISPTTDFAKEALFNILRYYTDFRDIDVLDLFSGSGNISYEFASRGAKKVISIEKNEFWYNFIQTNIDKINLQSISVFQLDAFYFIQHCKEKFDIIFADPPYNLENIDKIPDIIFDKNLLYDEGVLIIEHGAKVSFSEHKRLVDHRSYGKVNFSFFQ
jgi:16S rRNA (guanine(966)-N(2))-methyltransferase RsmD